MFRYLALVLNFITFYCLGLGVGGLRVLGFACLGGLDCRLLDIVVWLGILGVFVFWVGGFSGFSLV